MIAQRWINILYIIRRAQAAHLGPRTLATVALIFRIANLPVLFQINL